MRRLTVGISLYLAIYLFTNCNSKAPLEKEIVGTWINPEGAKITLNRNHTFSSDSLLASIFIWWDAKLNKSQFKGNGDWKIIKGSSEWEIELLFKMTNNSHHDFLTQVYCVKQGDKWEIFKWREEEGSVRFIFTQTSN